MRHYAKLCIRALLSVILGAALLPSFAFAESVESEPSDVETNSEPMMSGLEASNNDLAYTTGANRESDPTVGLLADSEKSDQERSTSEFSKEKSNPPHALSVQLSSDTKSLSLKLEGGASAGNVAFFVQGVSRSEWVQAYRQNDGSWSARVESFRFGSGPLVMNAWATVGSSTDMVASATETVPAMTANVSTYYDENSSQIVVAVSDIVGLVDDYRAAVGVCGPLGVSQWFPMIRTNDGWSLAVEPSLFGWMPGEYKTTLAIADSNDNTVVIGSYGNVVKFGGDTCAAALSEDASLIALSAEGFLTAKASNIAFCIQGTFGTEWVQATKTSDSNAWSTTKRTAYYGTGEITITAWGTIEGSTFAYARDQVVIPDASSVTSFTFARDRELLSLEVNDAFCPNGISTVACGVSVSSGADSITHWVPLERQQDGMWRAEIDPSEYNWISGVYSVVTAVASDYGIAYVTSRLDFDINYGRNEIIADTDASKGTVCLRTQGGGVEYASNIAFRIDADGSGSHKGVKWIQATSESDGSWDAVVSAAEIGSGRCTATTYASIHGKTMALGSIDFNISSASGTISSTIDRELGTLSVVLSDVSCETPFRNAAVAVQNGNLTKWYDLVSQPNGTYSCLVNIVSDFGGLGGAYLSKACVADIYDSSFQVDAASENLAINNPVVEAVLEESGPRLWMSAREGLSQYASNVAFRIQSASGVQWVQAYKDSNGSWSANISASNLGYGSGNVMAYATFGPNTSVFGSKGFLRYEPVESVMFNKAQIYGSSTSWLILVDTSNCRVGIYFGSYENWTESRYWTCSPGAWSTPTIKGVFSVGSRGYYFDSGGARCFYYTQFYGNYLFHSTLCYPNGAPMDDRLGMNLSHGCVRLAIENAKWIYDNIPSGTTVVTY